MVAKPYGNTLTSPISLVFPLGDSTSDDDNKDAFPGSAPCCVNDRNYYNEPTAGHKWKALK